MDAKLDTGRLNHNGKRCLSESVRESLEIYFETLDGHDTSNLYDLFIQQVEKPLLEVVLKKTNGNISRASELLGMNRGTLRNRLKKYHIS
ncbi:MAG: Fis family transcriptional regulator [Thiotrichales bacterium]|nr:Fis family transcriptional regulator [Thiotrichales bacterium]